MSEHYKSAKPWHRFQRMVERRASYGGGPYDVELDLFYRQVESHLSGSWLKSEIQACGVRLYVLYREIEEQLGRDGRLESFALVLGVGAPALLNWLRGNRGVKRYTIAQLHSWSTLLTRHWSKEQVVVTLLCHPTGVIEPLVSGDSVVSSSRATR
jgi:transcriptional regulator with XRE-family HTH domain